LNLEAALIHALTKIHPIIEVFECQKQAQPSQQHVRTTLINGKIFNHIVTLWLLVGKPEGSRSLGKQRRRWLDNIRIDLVEVGWGDVDWIGLAQDRDRWRALVNSVLKLRVP
jgi:hypothetical protein